MPAKACLISGQDHRGLAVVGAADVHSDLATGRAGARHNDPGVARHGQD